MIEVTEQAGEIEPRHGRDVATPVVLRPQSVDRLRDIVREKRCRWVTKLAVVSVA
jgi:hypothetical protein